MHGYAASIFAIKLADMPDLLIRSIDDALTERIKRFTRDSSQPLNACMLELIRLGLDAHEKRSGSANQSTETSFVNAAMRETRILGGTWNSDEASAFSDALKAIEKIPNT
jgi:hypothetical protein